MPGLDRRFKPLSPLLGLCFLGDEFRGFVSTLTPGQILPALRALIHGDPQLLPQTQLAPLFDSVWETSIAQL